MQLGEERGQVPTELLKTLEDGVAPWDICLLRLTCQPVTDLPDELGQVVAVILDVLTGDIGNVLGVAVSFSVKDQRFFVFVGPAAVYRATDEQPQFVGHIEPRQALRIEFGPRDVVNPQGASLDNLDDLCHSSFSEAHCRKQQSYHDMV